MTSITTMTHEEFQFNAKVLGYDIATNNIYNAKVLQTYLRQFFSDDQVHPVPNSMIINGTIHFPTHCISLPKDKLHVKGSLILTGNQVSTFSDELIVDVSLVASGVRVSKLPNVFDVNYDVFLNASNIQVLPDDFIVNGSLDLTFCKNLQVLPKNLKVLGDLYLSESSVTMIPDCTKANKIIKDF